MHAIFIHDHLQILHITDDIPPGLSERLSGERFSINESPYNLRGWCFFEHKVAKMKTLLSDDLELPLWQQSTPLLPDQFEAELKGLHFSHQPDLVVVAELYRKAFNDRILFVREIAQYDLKAVEVMRQVRLLPLYVNLRHLRLVACEMNVEIARTLTAALQGGTAKWPSSCREVSFYLDECSLVVEDDGQRRFGGNDAGEELNSAAQKAGVTYTVKSVSECSHSLFHS